MQNSAAKILYQKAVLIFEELCFLMPCSDTDERPQADSISSRVSFEGPVSGCFLLSLSPETLALLSANMIGESTRLSVPLEQDALKEIANVICGNALPAIYGPDAVFHLGIPELLDDPDSVINNAGYAKEAQAHVIFDAGYAAVTLLTQNTAAAA